MLLLGAGWKRDALRPVGGLTLLGRALLALADGGVDRIAIVGHDPESADRALVSRALAGRRLSAAVVHVSESDPSSQIARACHASLASAVIVLPQPVLIGERVMSDVETRPLADLNAMAAEPQPAPSAREDRSRLEQTLFDEIRKPMEIDGAVAWFLLRPISARITRLLWSAPISPNLISVVALVLGVASGPTVALGGRGASMAAALLLLVNVLLDCVDGELARLTHRKSRLGEWLDTVGDDASLLSYLVGLGVVVQWLPFQIDPWTAAVAAAVLFAVSSAYVYYVLVHVVGKVDTALFPRTVGRETLLAYAMKRDFFVLLFLVLAVFGLEWISLMLICLGSIANAAAVLGTAVVRRPRAKAPTRS